MPTLKYHTQDHYATKQAKLWPLMAKPPKPKSVRIKFGVDLASKQCFNKKICDSHGQTPLPTRSACIIVSRLPTVSLNYRILQAKPIRIMSQCLKTFSLNRISINVLLRLLSRCRLAANLGIVSSLRLLRRFILCSSNVGLLQAGF